ncbi:threonine ammonia-lyase, biosynthetic [Candidatus Tachikawaea gelatinosa]|uniref:L-threonine dehydratase n=1 Tax=Candidatus Tachikawaea gelatinosa TaxID=1410383 RepID=A0A090BWD4_9ENTR|nr:threonine ammonia-lyase, biosynthetic [Candidatus Tachikawaea gelatinosa]BAP58411.1 threonine dehydratase biosynthetic [Candidatus Tachikawaea gelatinosa]
MIDSQSNNNHFISESGYLSSILRAPVYEVVQITPLQKMEKISLRFNNIILAKREDMQPVHSFKLRGAYSMISQLSIEEKKRGIVTASAGNHGQGVAFSAKKLGIKSLIVMPVVTTKIKIDAVHRMGGETYLFGSNFDESNKKAIEIAKKNNYIFIPPFDHPSIIAGQGTIAMELLQQDAHIDRIFVPVGGGGLVAGIIVFIKQLMPHIQVIGVEAEDSACLKAALLKGKPVSLSCVGLFAEGVAVKKIGLETFRLCKKYLDDIITVNNDSICSAIKDLFEDVRAISEPSGALALAGMKKYICKKKIKGEKLAHIVSGANVNFHSLRYISERCELGEKQEILLAVMIPEKKGSFLDFCKKIGKKIITELSYRYFHKENACILIGISLANRLNEKKKIIDNLIINKYKVIDLSKDEMAKLHIRYMIGGYPSKNILERLFSFEFPESPLALLKFLKNVSTYWNISLFHYRNYGTDYGRVLTAFHTTKNSPKFEECLNNLGYRFHEETNNPAFCFFLKK